MKRTLLCLLIVCFCVVSPVLGQEASNGDALAALEDMGGSLEYSLTTDFAYYPLSSWIPAASGNRFAPITGPYDGIEARTTFSSEITIPVPFGDGPLVNGNTLVLGDTIEMSPISLKTGSSISLTPIAFLVATIGADIGTGWSIGGNLFAIGDYNTVSHKYEAAPGLSAYWWDFWAEGTFQFDLAALIPGEWNHIVTQDTYHVAYSALSTKDDGVPYKWQSSKESVNGWSWEATLIFAYQMPLVLNTVGVQTVLSGRFKDDMTSEYAAYKSDFSIYSINPIAIFEFSEHDSLTTQLSFSSRRAYATEYDESIQSELDLTTTGREWFFNRIAFSWKHTF